MGTVKLACMKSISFIEVSTSISMCSCIINTKLRMFVSASFTGRASYVSLNEDHSAKRVPPNLAIAR